MSKLYYCYFKSPIGSLLLAGTQNCLHHLAFESSNIQQAPSADWQLDPKIFDQAISQLTEYFAGQRNSFSLNYFAHGTAFQKRVLQAVSKIPYAGKASYSDIAKQIDKPLAVRAVGMANATNRLPIIIPCHRVIGKNGSLTGFAGGVQIKQYLLDLEQQAVKVYN